MMSWLFRSLILVVTAASLVTTVHSTLTLEASQILSGHLANLQFHNNILYIGGTNTIYALNIDLSVNASASTCNDSVPDCENVNKVLVVDNASNKLVTCGTGNDGICEIRPLDNIRTVQYKSTNVIKSGSSSAYLVVSTDTNRPAHGMITDNGTFMIAVTFGSDIETSPIAYRYIPDGYKCETYKYAISTRSVSPLTPFTSLKSLHIGIKENVANYIIFYKSVFQYNGFSYFVTNQKEYVGGEKYVTKLVRLCQNDTEYLSYADIVLTCNDHNLIQNADVIEFPDSSDTVFIGTFTKGEDPEHASGDTVICSERLSVLDENIMEAKIDYVSTCEDPSTNADHRYLPNLKDNINACETDKSAIVETDYECQSDPIYRSFSNVIGDITFDMPPKFTLDSGDGHITTLHGMKLQDDAVVVMAGTSKGKLVRMYVDKATGSIIEYDRVDVDTGFSMTAILQVDDETLYLMSASKILKYQTTNCTEYATCKLMMEGRNPLCGWCVFKNRATRKDLCAVDKWLSSLTECISLDLDVTGAAVGGSTGRYVTLTARHLPEESLKYSCRFRNGNSDISTSSVIRVGNDFNCSIPDVIEHIEARLELLVDNDIVLASVPFLFYNCAHFHRCGDCVKTLGSKCGWCSTKTKAQCILETDECTGVVSMNYASCPQLLDKTDQVYVSNATETMVTFNATNLVGYSAGYSCIIDALDMSVAAVINGQELYCNISITLLQNEPKKKYFIQFGYTNSASELDDDYGNYVLVYSCKHLGTVCSHCLALKSHYNCGWCGTSCDRNTSECSLQVCPAPVITKIVPIDGHIGGQTRITIYGRDLGSLADEPIVFIGEHPCAIQYYIVLINDDFKHNVSQKLVCQTALTSNSSSDLLVLRVNHKRSNNNITFSFKEPLITSVSPIFGPVSGGTRITFYGENLGIGCRKARVTLKNYVCRNETIIPEIPMERDVSGIEFSVQCVTSPGKGNVSDIKVFVDGKPANLTTSLTYRYISNPVIGNLGSNKAFLSGGTTLTVSGSNMMNANEASITVNYAKEEEIRLCDKESSTSILCKVPKASEKLQYDLKRQINAVNPNDRKRREASCSGCIEVKVVVKLDGVEKSFKITYFRDPSINPFDEDVVLFGTDTQELKITGEYLNLVATKFDVNITIGLEVCSVIELTELNIRCLAPKTQPRAGVVGSQFPEVNVTIGNIGVTVGYLEYQRMVELAIIAVAIAGGLFFVIVIVIIFGIVKYRKIGKKARKYRDNLKAMEMEIIRVAREEFLDMHTTMSGVNKNLVERGFPYHDYQQYACNVMFSVDYLWAEPVMTDVERQKTNKGMESLESLIINKFFLVSVISTMEKQKRFFIREKANLAGNLCAILMGKMDYLNEILKLLVTNLVQESTAKKRKTLFRRCESITEKLLSNWLSLTLYPHIKVHSGSPLYLLYVATQKTMESGPIDAVTEDAKYTLSEEKLLKNWCSASTEDGTQDLKFEAKTLTLNVIVDNGEEIYRCKTLDCDTITQVKSKCLTQIYVNYPASRLNVQPNELALEWHEGFGGFLKLQDVDNTTKQEGHSVRLNTLAHYNVKDETNMALIDPQHIADIPQQEDYVNLAQVQMDMGCNGSMDSTEPLAPQDKEKHEELQHWHLVKKEEDTSKQGKSAIAELYFNRLFTTKQSLLVYMRSLFDIILDKDNCPPPTKFLYDFLDELGDKNKVESNTVHAWKSHSYAIRVWASLMKMPNLLFDVNIPSYVASNLEIISQVFIESFSLSSQKFTKDSPSQKLIFHHEMNDYRDRVKEFYKNVNVNSQNSEEQRHYMSDVNKLQQQTKFNKISALYRFYQQLNPYLDEILEDLAMSKETSSLQLDKKLEQVRAIMEEDDD